MERFFGWLKSFKGDNYKIWEAGINIQSPSNNSINNHPPKIRNLEMSSAIKHGKPEQIRAITS